MAAPPSERGRIYHKSTANANRAKRKDAEENERRSNEHLRSILDNSPAEIVMVEPNGRIAMANDRFFDHATGGETMVVGRDFAEVVKEMDDLSDIGKSLLIQAMATVGDGNAQPLEFVADGPGGIRYLSGFAFPLPNSYGAGGGAAMMVMDITERRHMEDALKSSESLLRAIIDHVPANFAARDLDGRFMLVNRSFAKMTGWDPGEVLGRKVEEIFSGERLEQIRESVGIVSETGGPVVSERTDLEADGVIRTRVVHRFPIFDGSGVMIAVGTFSTDITDRKRVEMEAQEARIMLRSVLDAIPVRVFWKDRDSRLLGANRQMAADMGFADPDDLIGISDFELFPHEDAARYQNDDRRVMITGQPIRDQEDEFHCLRNGRRAWSRKTKVPLRDALDNIVGVICCYDDITEEKRLTLAVGHQEIVIQSFIDNSPNVIVVSDMDGRFMRVNQAFLDCTGLTLSEIEGRSMDDLEKTHGEFVLAMKVLSERVAKTHTPQHLDVRIMSQDGGVHDMSAWHFPIQGKDGKMVAMGTVSTDVTEMKATARALSEREAHMRAILDHSPVSIFVKDVQGNYTLVNRRFIENAGRDLDGVIGKTAKDVLGPNEGAELLRLDQEVARTRSSRSVEMIVPRQKGQSTREVITKFPIFDKNDEMIGIGGIAMDISEVRDFELQVKHSKQILQTVIDAIPIAVFWKDESLRFMGCNRKFLRDAGFERYDELIGKRDDEMPWRASAEAYNTDDKWVIENGASKVGFEETLIRSDMKSRWLRTTKVPLPMPDGGIGGVVCCYEDITETKRMNAEMERTNALFKHIMDNVKAEIIIKDIEGRFLMVNEFFEIMHGVPAAEVVGKTAHDIHPKELADDVVRSDRLTVETREATSYRRTFLTKTGRHANLIVNKFPVFDEDNNVIAVANISSDIGEIVKKEMELRKSDLTLRSVMETSLGDMIVRDAECRIVDANSRFFARLGITRDEAVGKMPEDIFETSRAAVIREHHEKVMATKEAMVADVHIRETDGSEFDFRVHRSPVCDDSGNVIAVVTYSFDNSQEKMIERALTDRSMVLDMLFDRIPAGIMIFNSRGGFSSANDGIRRMCGRGESALAVGKTLEEIVGEWVRLGVVDDAARDGLLSSWRQDGVPLLHSGFKTVEISGREYAVTTWGGANRWLAMMLLDTSDMESIREASVETLMSYRAILDTALDMIYRIDSSGRIMFVSESCKDVLGIEADKMTGRNISEFFVEAGGFPRFLSRLESAMDGVAIERIALRRIDGDGVPVIMTGKAIAWKGSGFVIVGSVCRQTTGGEPAGKDFGLVGRLAEMTPSIWLAIGEDGKVEWANPAFDRLIGRGVGTNSDIDKVIIWKTEEGSFSLADVAAAALKSGSWFGDVAVRRKNDAHVWLRATAEAVDMEDGRRVCLVSGCDISEMKRLVPYFEMAHRLEAMSEMIGGIIHKINNSLAAIQVNAEILGTERGGRMRGEICKAMLAAVEKGSLAAKTLKDVSFKGRRAARPVNTVLIMDEIQDVVARIVGRSVRVSVSIDTGTSDLLVDRGSLFSVIAGLTKISKRSMPLGGRIEIEARNGVPVMSDGTSMVHIEMRDDGLGVPIGRPVGEEEGASVEDSRLLLRGMGGSLSIESRENLGTLFRISLPAAMRANERQVTSDVAGGKAWVGGNERILLVEGDEVTRTSVSRTLRNLGYDVMAVKSGVDGLAQIKEDGSTDLAIVSVLGDSEMDGFEFARRAKEEQGGLRILFASGLPVDDLGERRDIIEKTGFIGKPFKIEEIAGKVRAVLDQAYPDVPPATKGDI